MGYERRERINYLCRGCNVDFSSLAAFDKHRTGTFDYDYSPDREDGRRCRSYDEMEAKGMAVDKNGRWGIQLSENAQEFFNKVRTL